MKLLHTSDWHLGKTIHGHDLLEDQEHVVRFIEKELENGYRAIIIAGDIYDRAVPPPESIRLFSDFVERSSKKGVEVIIIPGNHDSPQRLSFVPGLLCDEGVHLRCGYRECIEPLALADEGERVQVFTLPFVEEAVVREQFPDEGVKDHASATGFLVSKMRERKVEGVPSVLVAHSYTGRAVVRSDSERELMIGDQGRVPSEVFSEFDYVALGHLHNPQTASAECNAYYSGSIMPYSFSEAAHEKILRSLCIKDGRIERTDIPIPLKRDFSVLEDSLENLLHDGKYERCKDDYVCAKLTDQGAHYDIQAQLLQRFRYLLNIDLQLMNAQKGPDETVIRKAMDSPMELFSLFLDKFQWSDPDKRKVATGFFGEAFSAVSKPQREGKR